MKKNLILISLDTVRADVAYSGKIKPINDLRHDSVSFLNTVSSSPLTPVSHATVLTGLQPYNHGIRHLFKEKVNKNVETLAQILKKEGYATGAIVACPGMNKWYDFCRGFDHYDDEIPRLPDGSDPLETVDVKLRGSALKRGEIVFERASEWLDKNKDNNLFLCLHFFDAHWPYEAPHKYGGNNYYEEEVAYSAHFMGKFIEKLKDYGLYNNTTIVCFSDHGEDLDGLYPNDKGGEKLGHPEELGHGCLLYDQTQKVAFIIKDKSLPKNKNIDEQVRLVDIVPTILNLLEVKYKETRLDGQSLLPIVNGRRGLNLLGYSETFYPEEQTRATGGKFAHTRNKKSFRINNKYKIITHLKSDQVEFYDLEKDPNELKDLNEK